MRLGGVFISSELRKPAARPGGHSGRRQRRVAALLTLVRLGRWLGAVLESGLGHRVLQLMWKLFISVSLRAVQHRLKVLRRDVGVV
jgi:hypothetical protein